MKILAVGVVMLIALAWVAPAGAQAPAAVLAFAPSASTVSFGANVPVDITVGDVAASPGLGGYDISLTFNPAVVRLETLTDAGLLTGGGNIVICVPAQIDNVAGKATANCTPIPLFSSPGPASGPAVPLLHASFQALAAGASLLDLAGSTLQAPDNSELSSTTDTGTITVAAAGPPAPTPQATAIAISTSTIPASSTEVTTTSTATRVATPSPPSDTPTAGALRPPATGTGGGSMRFSWPLAAGAASLAVVLLSATVAGVAHARRGKQ